MVKEGALLGCFAKVQIPLTPPRSNLHEAPFQRCSFLFVSVGVKATGKGACSDLPQKSDHSLSSPYSTFLPGSKRSAGDPLHALCPVCTPTYAVHVGNHLSNPSLPG